jgi:hypothetical protein
MTEVHCTFFFKAMVNKHDMGTIYTTRKGVGLIYAIDLHVASQKVWTKIYSDIDVSR